MNIAEAYIQNTDEIAQKCQVEIEYHQDLLPKYKTPDDQSSDEYLWELLMMNKSSIHNLMTYMKNVLNTNTILL